MEHKQKKNKTGFLVAMMVLVGFPLLAMYYMNKGVRYRKNLFAQLEDYGQIANLSKDANTFQGKVVAIYFLDGSDAAREALTKMHDQFDNRQDVLFFVDGNYPIEDTAQIKTLSPSGKEDLAKALPAADSNLKGKGFLMDREGHLRKQYDLSQDADIQLFVRQLALFLPPKKTPKAELKRETEK